VNQRIEDLKPVFAIHDSTAGRLISAVAANLPAICYNFPPYKKAVS